MAPRLIPPSPSFASTAEEAVWRRLKAQLPAEAFLAANVHVHTHQDVYEADLVVGYPEAGFAVIEVKGGRVDYRDGAWWQATRDGLKQIDPAGQADRAKRLLDAYARERGWRHGPLRFESLVAFPDIDVGPQSPAPDMPRWALIARGDLADAAERVFAALNRRVSDVGRPTVPMVAELADLIGGRGDPQGALLGVAAAREEHVQRLTEGQYLLLRAVSRNPCVLAVGGPGTGKTWLALEQARRYAADGRRVLFVCYSRGLARWVQGAVDAMGGKVARRITVRTFHALGVAAGVTVPDGAGQAWWDDELPQALLPLVASEYDALVVDEAQDFADSWWPPVLAMLREQRMFVAGDDRQAVFSGRRGRPPVSLTELSLWENLRNTKQIAAVVNPLAEDRMTFLGGDGPPVEFIACATDDVYDLANTLVERLLEEGHPAGHVAVLTTCHRHPFHRATEEALGKSGYWDGFWLDDEVFYGTVMGFKGLERPVVVLAVDGFHEGVARDVMYAGLSRARDRLIVCGDGDVIHAAVGKEVTRRLTSP